MPPANQLRYGGTARPATVTSTVDGRDHLVSQQTTAAGLVIGNGEYAALCGRLVMAAPLVAAPGPTCIDCQTARHRVSTAEITSHRRRGRLGRLLHRDRRNRRSTTGGAHRAERA